MYDAVLDIETSQVFHPDIPVTLRFGGSVRNMDSTDITPAKGGAKNFYFRVHQNSAFIVVSFTFTRRSVRLLVCRSPEMVKNCLVYHGISHRPRQHLRFYMDGTVGGIVVVTSVNMETNILSPNRTADDVNSR